MNKENYDVIERPQHYACEAVTVSYTVEPIELCEQCGFLLGNALKYLFRYQHKGKPLEDLKKARYYLERLKTADYRTVLNIGWSDNNRTAMAFKNKEFFKYCDVSKSSVLVLPGLLKFTKEKIAELESKND